MTAQRKTSSVTSIIKGSLLLLIPVGFFLLFYLLPLCTIFQTVITQFLEDFHINWDKIGKVFGFTTWQAVLSMILTMILGMPVAWIFSRYKFIGKKFLKSLFSVPFILPTVVTAAAFNALIGPKGLLNVYLMQKHGFSQPPIQLINTIWIILIAHIFYNISVVMRIVGNAWENIDIKLENAASTLGCTPWQTFWKITFPLLKPAIFSAMLLVFLFDFTSYGVVLLLGGAKFRTIEVEIAQQALQLFNLPVAGLLSILQIIVTVAVTSIENKIGKNIQSNRMPHVSEENMRKPTKPSEKIIIILILFMVAVFLVSPLLGLVIRSFVVYDSQSVAWTMEYYKKLFVNERNSFFYVPPILAVGNSLLNATIASFISLMIGLMVTFAGDRYPWTKKINMIFLFPIGTSAVTLGLGYLLYFSHEINNPLLIPLAHSLIGLPFVIRSLQPVLQNIPISLHHAATVLGANPWKVFLKIDIPILRRAMINAGIFSFTISLGEFGATSFLSMPDRPTIPIAIYRFLGQPGASNYGQAMAISTILMTFCLVGTFILESNSFQKQ